MNIITIRKRLVTAEQIALVEPFDPESNPEFKPEKDYKARVVLLNRDTVLLQTSPQEFSETNGFHFLADENVAVSPTMAFRVETFMPTENFKPKKEYRSRIKWRDPDGNDQSKLLVMEPEAVVFELSRRGAERPSESKPAPRRPARRRRSVRTVEAAKPE
jgi:hypothetical protein